MSVHIIAAPAVVCVRVCDVRRSDVRAVYHNQRDSDGRPFWKLHTSGVGQRPNVERPLNRFVSLRFSIAMGAKSRFVPMGFAPRIFGCRTAESMPSVGTTRRRKARRVKRPKTRKLVYPEGPCAVTPIASAPLAAHPLLPLDRFACYTLLADPTDRLLCCCYDAGPPRELANADYWLKRTKMGT